MQDMLLPILIAVSIALLAWAVIAAIGAGALGEKKKIKERLAGEVVQEEQAGNLPKSITVQMEAQGLSGKLARWSFFNGLHRKIIQAYPDDTLVKFLTVAGWLGVGAFILVTLSFESLPFGLVAGA